METKVKGTAALAPENQERARLLNLIRIELAGLTEEESEELLQWLRKKRQSTQL